MYSIIRKDGTEYGPVSADMIKDWLGSDLLDEQTKIRRTSETEWTTIGALPEFAEHLPPPLPPVPPPKPYSLPSSQPAAVTSYFPDLPLIRTPERPNLALKILIGVTCVTLAGFFAIYISYIGMLLSVFRKAPAFEHSANATAVAIVIFTAGLLLRNRISLYLTMGASLLSSVCAVVILFAHFGRDVGYIHRACQEDCPQTYMHFVGCTLGALILPVVMLILKRSGRAKPNNPSVGQSAEAEDDVLLASRWQRLGASLIDALVMAIFAGPIMFLLGGFETKASTPYPSALWGFGAFFFVLFNGKLLRDSGQTIGKRLVGIQIVDLQGELPSVQKHLLPRYAFYLLVRMIPFAGPFIGLINLLFIFGEKKRCLHDFLAGTKVVIKG